MFLGMSPAAHGMLSRFAGSAVDGPIDQMGHPAQIDRKGTVEEQAILEEFLELQSTLADDGRAGQPGKEGAQLA